MKIDKLYSIDMGDVGRHLVECEARALLTYDQALALRDALNKALGLDSQQGKLFDDVPTKPPMKAPPAMFGGMKVGEAFEDRIVNLREMSADELRTKLTEMGLMEVDCS